MVPMVALILGPGPLYKIGQKNVNESKFYKQNLRACLNLTWPMCTRVLNYCYGQTRFTVLQKPVSEQCLPNLGRQLL